MESQVDEVWAAHQAAKAAELAEKQKEFRRRQITYTNHFRKYRFALNRDVAVREGQFPVYANYKEVDHDLTRLSDLRTAYPITPFRPGRRRSIKDVKDTEKRRYGRSRINEVSRKLFFYGIRFRRVISCGGMGIAALFEVQNRATGLYNKIVAKIALAERYNDELKKEKKYLNIVKDNDHFLKVKTVKELRNMTGGYPSEAVNGVQPADPSKQPSPTEEQMQHLDADGGIMLTEYLPFGSLNHWIGKASDLNQAFSVEACWRMLLCLAKAAAAMKEPSANPTSTGDQADDIVHFDLDPSNILIDGAQMTANNNGVDYDNPEGGGGPTTCDHDRSLLLKVADFGVATTMSEEVKKDHNRLWNLRTSGKTLYYAPEQWTAEWEAVVENPLTEDGIVAGQYSAKTNIYHIGIVMLAIMCRTQPDPAPQVVLVPVADYQEDGFTYLDQTPKDYLDFNQISIYSMGWIMASENCIRAYEPSLRELVTRMTAYVPSHRPTPEELVKICEKRINHGFRGAGIYLDDAWWLNEREIPPEDPPKNAFRPDKGAVNSQHTLPDSSSIDDTSSSGIGVKAPRKKPTLKEKSEQNAKRQAEADLAIAQLARQAIQQPAGAQGHVPAALVEGTPLPSPNVINQNYQQPRSIGNVAAVLAGLPLATQRPPSAVPFFGAPAPANPGAVLGLRHAIRPTTPTGAPTTRLQERRAQANNAAANIRHERALNAVQNSQRAQAARAVRTATGMMPALRPSRAGVSKASDAAAGGVLGRRQGLRSQRQQQPAAPPAQQAQQTQVPQPTPPAPAPGQQSSSSDGDIPMKK